MKIRTYPFYILVVLLFFSQIVYANEESKAESSEESSEKVNDLNFVYIGGFVGNFSNSLGFDYIGIGLSVGSFTLKPIEPLYIDLFFDWDVKLGWISTTNDTCVWFDISCRGGIVLGPPGDVSTGSIRGTLGLGALMMSGIFVDGESYFYIPLYLEGGGLFSYGKTNVIACLTLGYWIGADSSFDSAPEDMLLFGIRVGISLNF